MFNITDDATEESRKLEHTGIQETATIELTLPGRNTRDCYIRTYIAIEEYRRLLH